MNPSTIPDQVGDIHFLFKESNGVQYRKRYVVQSGRVGITYYLKQDGLWVETCCVDTDKEWAVKDWDIARKDGWMP